MNEQDKLITPSYSDMKTRITNHLEDHPGTIKACNKNHVSPYMMATNWLTGYTLDHGKEAVQDLWAYIMYSYDEMKGDICSECNRLKDKDPRLHARFIMFEDICVEGWPSQTKGFFKRWEAFVDTGDWYATVRVQENRVMPEIENMKKATDSFCDKYIRAEE